MLKIHEIEIHHEIHETFEHWSSNLLNRQSSMFNVVDKKSGRNTQKNKLKG